MSRKITQKVTWLGKIYWELKKFHGNQLSIHMVSSYNAYPIRDKKTVLIDTVRKPFAGKFVQNLEVFKRQG